MKLKFIPLKYANFLLAVLGHHRGVLFDGMWFQQTRNTIACLQLDHIQWFASTTDRFTLQLYGEFNWKYSQIGLLCSLWFPNFIQWTSWAKKNYRDRRWLAHNSNSTLPKMEFKTFLRSDQFTCWAKTSFHCSNGSSTSRARNCNQYGRQCD